MILTNSKERVAKKKKSLPVSLSKTLNQRTIYSLSLKKTRRMVRLLKEIAKDIVDQGLPKSKEIKNPSKPVHKKMARSNKLLILDLRHCRRESVDVRRTLPEV